MAPHSSILPWKVHGQRSLVGYNPWGCKVSDTTEQLSTHTIQIIVCSLELENHCLRAAV